MRIRFGAAVLAAAALGVAAPAPASTTWEAGDTLYYVAAAGEPNALNVNLQGADATVQDNGYPPMGMVAPCRPWGDRMLDGTGALCPAAPLARLVVDLGDGSDSLSAGAMTPQPLPTAALGGPGNDRLWSGPGNDDLTGGPGQDVIESNGGNDLVDARDDEADTVDCGDGTDVAIVDPADNVTNCETTLSTRPAERPAPVVPAPPQPTVTATRPTTPAPPILVPPVSPAPSPGTTSTTRPPDVHLRLVVPTMRLRTARTAGLQVRATCGVGCRVRAVVRVSSREQARRLRVPLTLASSARTGAADGVTRLQMRLRGRNLAKVRRVRVTIHAVAVTAAGQRLVQDVSITLRH